MMTDEERRGKDIEKNKVKYTFKGRLLFLVLLYAYKITNHEVIS